MSTLLVSARTNMAYDLVQSQATRAVLGCGLVMEPKEQDFLHVITGNFGMEMGLKKLVRATGNTV
jgi:hypothetical protein